MKQCMVKIRLARTDAPEERQPDGTVAKVALSTVVLGKFMAVQRPANAPLVRWWQYFMKSFVITWAIV
jgi:hypothetical protein